MHVPVVYYDPLCFLNLIKKYQRCEYSKFQNRWEGIKQFCTSCLLKSIFEF